MNKVIYLKYIDTLMANLNNKSKLIQILLGPRQVGKTTTILKMIDEHYSDQSLYVSADKVFNSDTSWLHEQWQTASQKNKILFIDEIQKIHNWAEVVKALYDEAKKTNRLIRCVLLGSSSLEIQKGLTESLTGRFQITYAHHWNYEESNQAYGLTFEQFLKYGGYPGAYEHHKDSDWANYVKNSIVSTVVEKDILQYSNVKNPALFRQAFDILIAYPAQEISYTKLLGQLQERGNVEIIKHYIALYEGAFLIKPLDKYSVKTTITKSSSPKILPLAPCLYYLTVRDEYTTQEKGRILELIVGAQLVRTGESLFYWREGKYEVDFVLKVGRQTWAIEVKSGRKKSTQGLDMFKKKFPQSKAIIITVENYPEFEKDPLAFIKNFAL